MKTRSKGFLEKLEHLYWSTLIWGHVSQYHINIEKSELMSRFDGGEMIFSSTFISEEEDIPDFLWEICVEYSAEIEKFLNDPYLWEKRQLVFKLPIPDGIDALSVNRNGDEIHPRHFMLVFKRDEYDLIGMTAYPFGY